MRAGFFENLDISGLIVSYSVFLFVGGAWGAATTGAMHALYGGIACGSVVLFCAFLASFTSDRKCVAAGVHIDLLIASLLSIVFAIQTYRSYMPAKMDRFPLFVIFTLGSVCHVAALIAKKPRGKQKA
ncbi:hypothetical protein KFE25_011288 [Diacronema lutheri]|uniref:Uncharacterized protein n=1 Tax=Diacronema lutheri TaxID=2081491 RepID=A0A8J6C782_DIALT|nr:hypothetical protein KFE25_011288 [Diacronema lutheri]